LPAPFNRWRERALVWGLAGVAAARVFLFAAAFPFFNNVDEQDHFDLVLQYARGQAPRRLVPRSFEAAQYIVRYSGPEYLFGPGDYPENRIPPPLWTQSPEFIESILTTGTAVVCARTNHEGSTPPLYYSVAGAWLRLGQACGIEGGFLLYWIRFLNVFLAAALVWIGYAVARLVYPENWFVRLGVPVLLAFYPQDTFYSIQSDVLSPLLFGLAFLGLLHLLRAEAPEAGRAALTGLAVAGTGLVKATNLPLLAVAAVVLLVKLGSSARAGRLRPVLPALLALVICAGAPLGAWSWWSLEHFGDLTGTTVKIQALGWTRKAWLDWWSHPLFTPAGLGVYWSELMASFWRGEFFWAGRRLAMPIMDGFYWASSLVLVGVTCAGLVSGRETGTRFQRRALGLALASFAALVLFLAATSMAFDFGSCFYPSRAHPFFTSGRLLTGALVPFLLLYLRGLDRLLCRWDNDRLRLLALAGIAVLIAVSEIKLSAPVFASAFNWFHLWTGPAGP
jgi:hypothetical protein